MKNRIFSILKFLIGWPLSILALFFIVKLVTPQAPQLLSQINHIAFPLVTCSIIFFLGYFFLRGYIWKRLVKQAGYDISYKDTNFIWAASELQRYIPGNIWSFLGRTVMLAEKGITKKDIAKCTLFEIEFLTLGAAVTSLLALPFLTNYLNFPVYLKPIIIIGCLLACLPVIFQRKLRIKLFFLPDYHPLETLKLIVLNALLFFFFGLGYFFTFASFTTIDPNLVWQLTGISVLAYLVGYLSLLTPSGIGVREGALIYALYQIMATSIAGFVSLFGRCILIVAEIIFVLLSYLWDKSKNKTITRIEKWIGEHKHLLILSLLFLVYVIYFSTITFLRYDNLYTGKFDLGNMSQTVWNTTQGRIFMFTNPDTSQNVSRLAVHADFILILFAPLYALWPDPRNLLFIQTLILASGAFFVYLLAKESIKNKNLALTFAFLYLLNPSLQRTNLYDFHAVTLATTFFLGAFYFFIKRRYKYFVLFALLAGFCKEQLWLIVALFGIFLFFQQKKRLFGCVLFTLGLLVCYYLISYAIPQALGSQHFALSYFAEFGDSPLVIVKNIVFNPQQTLGTLLQHQQIDYLKQLFLPLGYLSLFSPIYLILAGPDLAINLLSNNAQFHQIYYQYTATVTPFLFIGAIYGVKYIKTVMLNFSNRFQHLKKSQNEFGITTESFIIIYLLITALYAAYAYGPLPGSRDANLDMITKQIKDIQFIDNALAQIPPDVTIAASNNIASHLSNREHLYVTPLGVEKAEYIVFYLTTSQPPISLAADQALVEKFKKNSQYQIIVQKGIFIIFKNMYHGN